MIYTFATGVLLPSLRVETSRPVQSSVYKTPVVRVLFLWTLSWERETVKLLSQTTTIRFRSNKRSISPLGLTINLVSYWTRPVKQIEWFLKQKWSFRGFWLSKDQPPLGLSLVKDTFRFMVRILVKENVPGFCSWFEFSWKKTFRGGLKSDSHQQSDQMIRASYLKLGNESKPSKLISHILSNRLCFSFLEIGKARFQARACQKAHKR